MQTFNPGELPLVLLALAESGPMKAYEFIAELERLFGPSYRASPGGVYPALTALADERLFSVEDRGRAKRYALTPAGRRALEQRRRQLTALEERTGARLRDAAALEAHLDRFADRVMKVAGRIDTQAIVPLLESTARQIERLGGSVDNTRSV